MRDRPQVWACRAAGSGDSVTAHPASADDLALPPAFIACLRGALAAAPHHERLCAFVLSGKLLRARLATAATLAVGGTFAVAATAGVAVELLHSAALLQDDIIDGADLRRGRTALHVELGANVALMLADYLIFEALSQLLTDGEALPAHAARAAKHLADCAQTCCRGQLADIEPCDPGDADAEERYRWLAERKTGAQFAAAATTGPILAGCDKPTLAALTGYGTAIGAAFQLRDDVLDICGDGHAMGKPTGNSLARGRLLLPLVFAVHSAAPFDGTTLWQRIAGEERRLLAIADEHLACLPDNEGTAILRAIARAAVERDV